MNRLGSPERLFLLFAIVGGLVLVALIPPLAGGNEPLNFQRAATIAAGHPLVERAEMPRGIGDLLHVTGQRFGPGAQPPYGYSLADFHQAAAVKLQPSRPQVLEPNAIAVLSPVSYLPQVPVLALGLNLQLPPLVIFYLGRLAGLLAGILLSFFAIRIMPGRGASLAAIALLPPVLFSRSTLDADQLTNGLAFLFVAMAAREIGGAGRLSARALTVLAVSAFLLAQAKSAYLLLPLLSLAIPVERFGSLRRKALACALICLPGIAASLGWMLLLKLTYFTAVKYRTWSGVVEPQRQLALVLSHPLAFTETLARTLFGTLFIPTAVMQFLGTFGPPVTMPLPFIVGFAGLLSATVIADAPIGEQALRAGRTKALALGLAVVTLVLVLTLLYLQWTRLGGPVIDGFNGRYLYPLAPLILLTVPSTGRPLFRLSAIQWLPVLGIVTVGGTWWMTWHTYYG